MKSRTLTALITGAVLALTLTSCSSPTEGSDMAESLTVEDAKKTAQDMETELAAFIPGDLVASIDQRPTGVLLRCSTEGSYQWTGSTTVRIVPGKRLDAGAVTAAIVAAYDGKNSLAAVVETTSDDEPRAHIVGVAGSGYLVSEEPDRTAVRIASFSPCFTLPEGMSPADKY